MCRVIAFSLLTLSVSLLHCGASRQTEPSANSAERSTLARSSQSTPRNLTPREIADRSTVAVVSVRSDNSLGTGFVVRADGWIATNLHVIEGGGNLSVTFTSGLTLPVVEILNASQEHDLAILRVEAHKLPVLPLGDSARVRPGDPVVAIGHPLGFEDTVSNGLVSALRQVNDQLDVLQISAPIAPGSSGGPLFDEQGRVIGVATAIIQGGQNLNFALPVKYVSALLLNPDPIPMAIFSATANTLEKRAPKVTRNVPRHTLALLNGCSPESHVTIARSLAAAIEVGAALYNEGDFAACYHVYEGAALDLSRRLPRTCPGPKRALSQGRRRAARLAEPSAQAWALRDAFDGLLEVIARRMDQEP